MDTTEKKFDYSRLVTTLKEHKTIITYSLLVLLLLFSFYIRLVPLEKFTGVHENSLSAMDPYWHLRHSEEVLENGFSGNGYKEIDGKQVEWDYLHNAPFGEKAQTEFYHWFSANGYRFFGKFFFSSFVAWFRITPVIFGTLSVLVMFYLGKQLFGIKEGLIAAFILSLSATFMQRSVAGFADTDSVIAFFTLLTFYFFIKAWDEESYFYGGLGGVSLGLFAWTWGGGFAFAPFLILATLGFYFVFNIAIRFSTDKNISLKDAIIERVKENWKKYLIIVVILAVGTILTAILVNPQSANFVSRIFQLTQFGDKEVRFEKDGKIIREVFLTVSELNKPSIREIISRVHIAPVLFSISFFVLLPFGLWKKLKGKLFHFIFFALWVSATLFATTKGVRFIEMLVLPMALFAGIAIAHLLTKINFNKQKIISSALIVIIFSVFLILPNISPSSGSLGPPYVQTALFISRTAGPSLDSNWLNFFEWARTNTNQGDIFASWWDPGHALTALGERPVVADGSQNPLHVHDLAVAFTSTNETESWEILKSYNVTYFFTSQDLIGKYGAISFLGTGTASGYTILNLNNVQQIAGGQLLIFDLGGGNSITVKVPNPGSDEIITASLKQGFDIQEFRGIYMTEGVELTYERPDVLYIDNPKGIIDAGIYIPPNFRSIYFLTPDFENNLLTRMQLLDGYGLEHFKYIADYGGHTGIKVYEVLY